jgi:hypothetical protein
MSGRHFHLIDKKLANIQKLFLTNFFLNNYELQAVSMTLINAVMKTRFIMSFSGALKRRLVALGKKGSVWF